MNNKKKIKSTPGQAYLKASAFCAYQERTQQQVRDKLYSYGLFPDEVEETISKLISENFINEERYAKAYAGGKFRIKQWGRLKILNNLKQKGLSAYCIKKGMAEIEPDDYIKNLTLLLSKKWQMTNEQDLYKKKYKVINWLISKGYELDLIQECIKELALK